MNLIDKIKQLFEEDTPEVNMVTSNLETGEVIEYENLEAGSTIYIIIDEDTKTELPTGVYTIDGKEIEVVDGLIAEGEVEENVEEEVVEEEMEEDKEDKKKEDEEMEEDKKKADEEDKEDEVILSIQEENDLRISKLEKELTNVTQAFELFLSKFETIKNEDIKEDFNKAINEIKEEFSKSEETLKSFVSSQLEDFENKAAGEPVQKLNKATLEEEKPSMFSKLSDYYKNK